MSEEEFRSSKMSSVVQKNTPKTTMHEIYSAMPLDENCFYIQYNSCQEAPDLSMKELVESVSNEIKKTPIKK